MHFVAIFGERSRFLHDPSVVRARVHQKHDNTPLIGSLFRGIHRGIQLFAARSNSACFLVSKDPLAGILPKVNDARNQAT